jgi:HKD family nuclease
VKCIPPLSILSILNPAISGADDIKIAVAFVSRRGLAMIEPGLQAALQANSNIEFLVGLDFNATEPKAVQSIYEYSRNNANFSLYCYASLAPPAIYHPKLYAIRSGQEVLSVIGSSNLTEGGLRKNIEVNVVIEGNLKEEIISDIYSTYNILKFNQKRIAPDKEYIMLYSELSRIQKDQREKGALDKAMRGLMESFNKKSETLRKPIPTKNDLVGWLELVYKFLPEGEFTNNQIYKHEREFQLRYPHNMNVKAKVRQQLQVLREMKMIEHIGKARWRKV